MVILFCNSVALHSINSILIMKYYCNYRLCKQFEMNDHMINISGDLYFSIRKRCSFVQISYDGFQQFLDPLPHMMVF